MWTYSWFSLTFGFGSARLSWASVRAKAEHCFHVVKCLFKHRKTRHRSLAKNDAQLFTPFCFANLVLARRFLGTLTPKLRPERGKRPVYAQNRADSDLWRINYAERIATARSDYRKSFESCPKPTFWKFSMYIP
jgi:hypothetical protein